MALREVCLLHLSAIGLLVRQHRKLDQLAGDRAAALIVAGKHVSDQCADVPFEVDAGMRPEPGILHGDDRVYQVVPELVEGLHVDAVFGAAQLGDHVSVFVVEDGGLRRGAEDAQIDVRRRINPRLGDTHDDAAQ